MQVKSHVHYPETCRVYLGYWKVLCAHPTGLVNATIMNQIGQVDYQIFFFCPMVRWNSHWICYSSLSLAHHLVVKPIHLYLVCFLWGVGPMYLWCWCGLCCTCKYMYTFMFNFYAVMCHCIYWRNIFWYLSINQKMYTGMWSVFMGLTFFGCNELFWRCFNARQ